MKSFVVLVLQISFILAGFGPAFCFVNPVDFKSSTSTGTELLASTTNMASLQPGTNICDLPGDPSLILTTNVDLGDKKMEIMKGM